MSIRNAISEKIKNHANIVFGTWAAFTIGASYFREDFTNFVFSPIKGISNLSQSTLDYLIGKNWVTESTFGIANTAITKGENCM